MTDTTSSWTSRNPRANTRRLDQTRTAVKRAEGAAHSALSFIGHAVAAGKATEHPSLEEAAALAVRADSAAAEAVAGLRDAEQVAMYDQARFEERLETASEEARAAWRLADLAIERCP